jgi:hypothetical protein
MGKEPIEETFSVSYYDKHSKCYRKELVTYTLSQQGEAAWAGNLHSGSDSISHIDALKRTVNELLALRSVIIIDGFRTSMVFVDWLEAHPEPSLTCLFVYLDIPAATNLKRLLARREASGRQRVNLPEKTHKSLVSCGRRAKRVFEYARSCTWQKPTAFVVIDEHMTPEEAADLVWKEIAKLSRSVYRDGGGHGRRPA